MTRNRLPALRGLGWEPLLLVGLTVFLLRPVLKTGYMFDDVANSLLPGALEVEGYTFAEYVGCVIRRSLSGGRFFPLVWVEVFSLLYLVQDLFVYKAVAVVGVAVDVVLFYALVLRVGKSRAFAGFAACCLLPLFQLRGTYDPILGFTALLQVVTAGVLVSLLALQTYLETGRRRWLALGVACYAAAALAYEVTYPLVLVHLALVWHGRRTAGQRLAASAPFVGVLAACMLATLYVRWFYLSAASPYQINRDIPAVLGTFVRQTSAALPLSYYLRNAAQIFPAPNDPPAVAAFALTRGGVAAFAGALLACLAALRADGRGPGPLGTRPAALLAAVGLLLAVLPGAVIALSARHAPMIEFGVGYLPVYIQYFGVALLLATPAWLALSRLSAGGALRRGLGVAAAVLLALTTSLTYRANAVLAEALPKSEGSPGYKPSVGYFGARWHHQRLNLEAALRAGLVEDVPEHSVVHLANEYPFWHDAHHSRYFYAMYGSKVLDTVPRTSRFRGEVRWFIPKDSLRAPRACSPHYLIRDVPRGEKAGYVVLSRENGPPEGGRESPCGAGAGEAVRLFVRHPALFAGWPSPRCVVSGDAESDGNGPAFVRCGRELAVIRKGPDWAVFALGPDAARVNPDSLAVSFGPTAVAWGSGFSYHEIEDGCPFRWCGKRGVVMLLNAGDSPRKVRVTMALQNRGDAPVVLEGAVQAEVPPGPAPVPLAWEATLPPGSHPLSFRTETSRVAAGSSDPRDLRFRVFGLKVEVLTR